MYPQRCSRNLWWESSDHDNDDSMVMVMIVTGWWLNPTPLKNMGSSVGMMTFPMYGKIKNVPQHQPDDDDDFDENAVVSTSGGDKTHRISRMKMTNQKSLEIPNKCK